MIKIEDVEVMGIRKAIKGMRNAMNSWDKSDSGLSGCYEMICDLCPYKSSDSFECDNKFHYIIGEADMKLAKRLIKAGSSDRKFLRMIHVQANVTAPLYWWKEYDTYKVGTTTNSTSTMHTIHKRDLTFDDFSYEHLLKSGIDFLQNLINEINRNRHLYTKKFKGVTGDNAYGVISSDKTLWWQIIQLLPSSFNQMRTIDLDYETLFSIYHQRKGHKLDEWRDFCKRIETFPYMKEFLGLDEQVEKEKRELS